MRLLIATFLIFFTTSWAIAQPSSSSGRSRGESRDSDRGSRWDRGSRPSSGEGGSGPPSGSRWGGSGGMFGGGMFGGGGGPGGPGGSFFSGGGLADMIRRFDRNNNNMIDPDEVAGPASFFLQRMAQNNPKIDLSRPIPIDVILGEIEKFRGGMMGGGSSEEESPGSPSSSGPELLVPNFQLSFTPPAVPGFGASSSKAANIQVTDRDRAEAEERLRRYDRNRDGFLTPDELSQGRWSGNPMDFDRNRDGKLSVDELAVRQANRRKEQEASSANNDQSGAGSRGGGWSGGWGGGGSGGWTRGSDPTAQGGSRGSNGDSKKEEKSVAERRFGESMSYRVSSSSGGLMGVDTKDLPAFFLSSDANGDGQITLDEFASPITEQSLAEFEKWDLNGDGIITAREAAAGVRAGLQGPSGSSRSASSSSTASRSSGSSSRSGPPGASNSSGPASSSKSSSNSGKTSYSSDDLEWAKRQIAKYDKDGDGMLSKDEWEKMIVKPDGADLDGDGKITAEEYATYRANR